MLRLAARPVSARRLVGLQPTAHLSSALRPCARSLVTCSALPLATPLLLRHNHDPILAPAACGPTAGLAKKAKGGKDKGGKKGKGKAAAAADDDDGDDGGDAAEGDGDYKVVDYADVERRMKGAVDAMQRDFASLNVGRATPTMLDSLLVTGPAGEAPLPTVAKVLLLSPQALQVSVFDATLVPNVCKAIEGAQLGLVPEAAGKMVKVPVPRATREARDAMVKQVKKMGDACKVAIRNVRQPAMKRAKGHPVKGEAKKGEKEVERLTEAANAKVDTAVKVKEKELLQV